MPPTPTVARGPLALLRQLEQAVRTRQPRDFISLFAPHCRRSCTGIRPFPLDRGGPGSMAVMIWTPTPGPGGLIQALGRLFFSYKELGRLELRPLGLRAGALRASLVVRIHLEGDDMAGRWRTDQGMARLSLRRDTSGWRVHRFDLLTLHSAWHTEVTLEARPLPGIKKASPPFPPPVVLGWPGDLPPHSAWAALDVDADGAVDLVTARGERVLAMAGMDQQEPSQWELLRVKGCGVVSALSAADWDGDGRTDLFVGCTRTGSGVWLNREQGGWAVAPQTRIEGVVAAAAWADLDGVGRPDLYVVRRRRPPGASSRDLMLLDRGLAAAPATRGAGLQACAADLDQDGDSELVVISEGQRPRLWLNQGGARFKEAGARLGFTAAPGATACAVADLNGDGRLDLLLGGRHAARGHLFGRPGAPAPGQGFLPTPRLKARLAGATRGDTLWLSRVGQGGTFTLEPRRLPGTRWTTTWIGPLDLDRDGAMDLLLRELRLAPGREARWWYQFFGPTLAGKKPPPLSGGAAPTPRLTLLSNLGRARFLEGNHPMRFPAAAVALAFPGPDASHGRPHLLLEDAQGEARLIGKAPQAEGHQLLLRLRAAGPNRDAVGSLIRLKAEGRHQVRQVGGASGLPGGPPGFVHFGLGAAIRAELVQVRWPSGKWQRFADLPADRLVTLTQGADAAWKDPAEEEPTQPGDTLQEEEKQDPDPPALVVKPERSRPLAWRLLQGKKKRPLQRLAGPRGTLLLIHGSGELERVRTLCVEIQKRVDPLRGIRAYRLGASAQLKGCPLAGLVVTPSVMAGLAKRQALLPLLMLLDGDERVVKELGAGLGLEHLESELVQMEGAGGVSPPQAR